MSKKTDKTVNASAPVKTVADQIWDDIKDLKIEMFALPEQRVNQYCRPIPIDPGKLFLVTSATSVLPSLEAVVTPKYAIERMDKYIVLSIPSESLVK